MSLKNEAYIALGTNMGERYDNLKDAILLLKENHKITLESTSSIYETDPVGYEEQDLFLNMVIKVRTDLTPFELLKVCQDIEKKLGRKRNIRWGPRIIDLDILTYNQDNIEAENLIIPHPRISERAFVIIPMVEIDQNLQLPKMEKPLKSWLSEEIPDKEGVRIWKQKNGEDVFALFAN